MKAIPYSQIGPLERGEPVLHNSQVDLVVQRIVAAYVCSQCKGLLGSPLGMIDGHTYIRVRCMVDAKHKGIRKPSRDEDYIARRLDLGIYGPPEKPALPKLEDIYKE